MRAIHYLVCSALGSALALSACAYGTQEATGVVLFPVESDDYPYAAIDPESVEREVVTKALVERGYQVLSPDAEFVLSDVVLSERSILWLTCKYRGHVVADAMGSTAAQVTCAAQDMATRQDVYLGRGKHVAMTVSGDMEGATRAALKNLPRRNGEGGVLSTSDAVDALEAQELATRGVPRLVPSLRNAGEETVHWRRSVPLESDLIVIRQADRFPSTDSSLVERTSNAVVSIIRASRVIGTAFVITRDGLAVTAHHILSVEGLLMARLRSGEERAVRGLRGAEEADVALLEIYCPTDCVTLDVSTAEPQLGSEVYVIGTPLSERFSHTVTRGIVSGLRRDGARTLIQTDAAANPGNSGGPIIDAESGMVVAVVTQKVVREDVEGLTFGVSSIDALRVLGIRLR